MEAVRLQVLYAVCYVTSGRAGRRHRGAAFQHDIIVIEVTANVSAPAVLGGPVSTGEGRERKTGILTNPAHDWILWS